MSSILLFLKGSMKRTNHSKSVGVRSAFWEDFYASCLFPFSKVHSHIVCVWNSFPLANSEHSIITEKLIFT